MWICNKRWTTYKFTTNGNEISYSQLWWFNLFCEADEPSNGHEAFDITFQSYFTSLRTYKLPCIWPEGRHIIIDFCGVPFFFYMFAISAYVHIDNALFGHDQTTHEWIEIWKQEYDISNALGWYMCELQMCCSVHFILNECYDHWTNANVQHIVFTIILREGEIVHITRKIFGYTSIFLLLRPCIWRSQLYLLYISCSAFTHTLCIFALGIYWTRPISSDWWSTLWIWRGNTFIWVIRCNVLLAAWFNTE